MDVGSTTTFDVVVESANEGVGSYNVDLALTDSSAASITDISLSGNPGLDNVNIADDGSSASVQVSAAGLSQTGAVTIFEVTVQGDAAGSSDLDTTVNSVGNEEGSEDYTIANTPGATVNVGGTGSADFQVSGLSAPSSVDQGQTVEASATITNNGDAEGTQTVEFQIDGLGTVDSEEVTLGAGDSQGVTLSASTDGVSPGTYTHGIYTDDDSQTAQITVEESTTELPDDADSFLESARTDFWAGQTLYFDGPSADAGENYALHRVSESGNEKFVGDFVTQLTLNSDGDRFLDTGRASIGQGEYVLLDTNKEAVVVDSDGTTSRTIAQGNDVTAAAFTVRTQTFSSSIDSAELTEGDSTTVDFDSTRGGYAVDVSSDSVDDEDISDVFPGADGTTISSLPTDATVDLNTSSLDPGTYEFTFEVTDTGITDSVSLTVTERGERVIEFGFSGSQSANYGTFLEVPVNVENTDTAQVTFGSDSDGYNVTVVASDGSDDGTVTIKMNTLTAGFTASDSFSTANSDDSIDSVSVNGELPNAPLDATSYELILQDPSDGSDEALSSFLLQDRNRGVDMQLWESPRGTSFSDRASVVDAIGSTVTPSDGTVAAGDLIIHQIEIDDFEAVWDSSFHGADSDTQTLLNLINNGQVSLGIEQTEDSAPDNRDPKSLDLDASTDAFSAIYSPDNSELYVVADTTELRFDRGSQTGLTAQNGDAFDVSFTVKPQDNVGLDDDEESVTRGFSVSNRRIQLDDPRDVTLNNADDQQVTGFATVAPGTEYRIQVRGPNLLDDERVSVDENGNFNATFDLSGLEAGDELRATLSGNGASDQETYTLEESVPPTASVSMSDQQASDGRFITVDSVTMSEGGFVAIHLGDAGGDVIGVSSYLSEGSHEDVAIRLDQQLSGGTTTLVPMPHLDDDNDREYDFPENDAPYTSDGSPVTDTAAVTVPTPEPTTTTTTTTTTTPEPTTTEPEPTTTEPPADTTTAEDDDTTTESDTESGDGPGFTAVLALIALIGAALLAARRNN